MTEQLGRSIQIEFGEHKPTQPLKYNFPNPVTRENFASMLVTSFRISGANSYRHMLYFALLEANTGFNYKASFKNFLESDGWNAFSPTEQNFFKENFESVKAHVTSDNGKLLKDFQNDPASELALQLSTFDGTENLDFIDKLGSEFEARYGPLVGLNQQQFLSHLNEMHPLRGSH